jgi:hypothetical protein
MLQYVFGLWTGSQEEFLAVWTMYDDILESHFTPTKDEVGWVM